MKQVSPKKHYVSGGESNSSDVGKHAFLDEINYHSVDDLVYLIVF